MNVLLIGGASNMMNAMIDKCNKNGHRVFLLTGGQEKKFPYKRVFEKCDFAYESEFGSIKYMIKVLTSILF